MPTIPTTALDTSLASLAAATTEVVIGCKTATSGLYCDSPSWRDSTSWDGIRKAGPATFDITVGDKIKFVYSYDHNVWWMPDRAAYDAYTFPSRSFGRVRPEGLVVTTAEVFRWSTAATALRAGLPGEQFQFKTPSGLLSAKVARPLATRPHGVT